MTLWRSVLCFVSRHALATGLALCTLGPAAAQVDFSKVEVTTEKLADGIYMLMGAGGNLGLAVGNDAVFLIDDQYAPLTPKIQAAIAAITRKPVQFVLNTHWHDDHTGGNERFAEAGALIVAHDNVRKRMSTEQFLAFFKMRVEPSPKAALPLVTFSTDVTFHINGDEVVALHFPAAHTDGDTIVHFRRADVIHMGDIHFNYLYPFIDSSSGGSADGVIAAVDRALALATDRTKIIPGHGPLASKGDLQAYRDMLATVAGPDQVADRGRQVDEGDRRFEADARIRRKVGQRVHQAGRLGDHAGHRPASVRALPVPRMREISPSART
jgi:glyoxylase-like metal-dependent hydrolase (beta-lactamase superfamily II)